MKELSNLVLKHLLCNGQPSRIGKHANLAFCRIVGGKGVIAYKGLVRSELFFFASLLRPYLTGMTIGINLFSSRAS